MLLLIVTQAIFILIQMITIQDFFQIDNLCTICTKPPACVLFGRSQHTGFEQLEPSVMPVFPIERSISLKGFSVRRNQVLICSDFCLMDYKVQGTTLIAAILHLKNDPTQQGQDPYRKYCSTYVQLSRL